MSEPAPTDRVFDGGPHEMKEQATTMATLEVWPLETDGVAIVSAESADKLRGEYERYVEIEETVTWGQFRAAGHPFDVASVAIERCAEVDASEYLAAVESANGINASGESLEERWESACTLPAGPPAESGCPSDDDPFEYSHGDYGATFEWSLMLQAAMLGDVPWEVIDQFELAYDSTLDGALGMVPADILDAVTARLIELGFEFA